MSLDLSEIPDKDDVNSSSAPDPVPISDEDRYNRQKGRLLNRLKNQLSRTNVNFPIRLRVGFLTDEDKTQLQTDLEAKGFTCSNSGNNENVLCIE